MSKLPYNHHGPVQILGLNERCNAFYYIIFNVGIPSDCKAPISNSARMVAATEHTTRRVEADTAPGNASEIARVQDSPTCSKKNQGQSPKIIK